MVLGEEGQLPRVEPHPKMVRHQQAADRDQRALAHGSLELLADLGGLDRATEEAADAAFHHPFDPLLKPIEEVHTSIPGVVGLWGPAGHGLRLIIGDAGRRPNRRSGTAQVALKPSGESDTR